MATFDPHYPTPILDEVANRMAEYLKPIPGGMGITDIARAIKANPSTIHTILHRDCPRHGQRFEAIGTRQWRPGNRTRYTLYRLKQPV